MRADAALHQLFGREHVPPTTRLVAEHTAEGGRVAHRDSLTVDRALYDQVHAARS
jgi:hypothetical protein